MAVIKIETISLTKMHNEDIFAFWTEFRSRVRNVGAETVHLLPVWDMFMSLYDEFKLAIEKIEKSSITETLDKLDRERDKLFEGFRSMVKGFLKSFDAAQVEAAKKILIIIQNYKNIPNVKRNEETGFYMNFIEELRTNYAPQLTTLNLSSWVTEMDKVNKEYMNVREGREDEYAAKELGYNARDIRKKLYPVYEECCGRILGGAYNDTTAACREFIKTWNIIVREYRKKLNIGRNDDDEKDNEI